MKHNCRIGISRGLKKLRWNHLPNLSQKIKWIAANMPLTYMSEIAFFLFSHKSHGLFSMSQTLSDNDLLKIQPSFKGPISAFIPSTRRILKTTNKKHPGEFHWFYSIFPNLRKKLCQSICMQIAGPLWSLAAGRVPEYTFSIISILHGCLLSAGAIILL